MAISSHFRAGQQVTATLRSFMRLDMSANNQLIEMRRDEVTEIDAADTRDWIGSLDPEPSYAGAERARYLLQQLEARAHGATAARFLAYIASLLQEFRRVTL
jgi:hypothetical protein